MAYNAQTTVDASHCIPIDYEVTNRNDSKAMGEMVTSAAEVVDNTEFTALYDKGYHTGSELKTVQDLGVETIVAIPDIPASSQAPDPAFNISEFRYHPRKDCYRCPAGKLLTTNGRWYNKQYRKKSRVIRVKHYKTGECAVCKLREKCTRNLKGRLIERSEYAEYIEKNRKNVKQKEALYKRRQTIVEHPYGTIKRQWGFSYIITKKGINRASSDVGLMFTAYNLRRLISIFGFQGLLTALLIVYSCFLLKSGLYEVKSSILSHLNFSAKYFHNLNQLV